VLLLGVGGATVFLHVSLPVQEVVAQAGPERHDICNGEVDVYRFIEAVGHAAQSGTGRWLPQSSTTCRVKRARAAAHEASSRRLSPSSAATAS